jgi:hypothetical protein
MILLRSPQWTFIIRAIFGLQSMQCFVEDIDGFLRFGGFKAGDPGFIETRDRFEEVGFSAYFVKLSVRNT